MFSWSRIKKPIIGLAPMAGYTDSPFRKICKEMGANILYSELISATALFYNPKDEKTLKLCSFEESERPFILQLFGKDPEHFVSAIKAVQDAGIHPDGIDINMGCPAKKVVKCGYGSALMNDPETAGDIIKEIKKSFDIPISVKTRSGWDSIKAVEFAIKMEEAGAEATCIHARTYKQGFTGKADWSVIKKVKETVKIPVIGNGDIKTFDDIEKMINETGCDGVLIGRGALGNPWIFSNQAYASADPITRKEIFKTILKHIDYAEEFYGKEKAGKEMRKHYGFYLKGLENILVLRKKLVLKDDLDGVKELLKKNQYGEK